MIKIVADENVDYNIIIQLRNNNFDVYSILENNAGISDLEVLKITKQFNAILLTADKDFGEIAFKNKEMCKGIVLYRLHNHTNIEKANKIQILLEKYQSQLENSFVVLNKDKVRIIKFDF
jgi:predicted nuclease of predicted toxin-antitoxin system